MAPAQLRRPSHLPCSQVGWVPDQFVPLVEAGEARLVGLGYTPARGWGGYWKVLALPARPAAAMELGEGS